MIRDGEDACYWRRPPTTHNHGLGTGIDLRELQDHGTYYQRSSPHQLCGGYTIAENTRVSNFQLNVLRDSP